MTPAGVAGFGVGGMPGGLTTRTEEQTGPEGRIPPPSTAVRLPPLKRFA
jgi:hypothetical protein